MYNNNHKYIKIFCFAALFILLVAGGTFGYQELSVRMGKQKVAESIEKRQFASNPNIDPTFKMSVDTSKSLDTPEGKAQFKQNLALLDKKIELMRQTNDSYANL